MPYSTDVVESAMMEICLFISPLLKLEKKLEKKLERNKRVKKKYKLELLVKFLELSHSKSLTEVAYNLEKFEDLYSSNIKDKLISTNLSSSHPLLNLTDIVVCLNQNQVLLNIIFILDAIAELSIKDDTMYYIYYNNYKKISTLVKSKLI